MGESAVSFKENEGWFEEPKPYRCPSCWESFGLGSVMNIRANVEGGHDPVLGPGHAERFYPSRFNGRGVALDKDGHLSFDLACPHCRRKLPRGFCETPHHIFSLVGAPGAGKSYYLSVLIDALQKVLYGDFGITFRDEDPTGNVLLNEMKNQIFAAESAEDAILDKTTLEGRMYEQLVRQGRKVALPKPFVYTLSKRLSSEHDASLVLYDNAGEHFQPGIDLDASPGALHVAYSSALIFLFNPASHPGFRRALSFVDDPQLKQQGIRDNQDILISEMEMRIKRLRQLSSAERVETPLAMVIGKSDLWGSLIDMTQMRPVLNDGGVDLAAVEHNSELLRELLLKYAPGAVANAEALSSNVRYFAASGLGHSPRVLEDGPMAGFLAPDPIRISPRNVEDPFLWALSQVASGLVKASEEKGVEP